MSFHIVAPRRVDLRATFLSPVPGVKENLIALTPLGISEVVSTLTFTGVLARHPTLRFVLVECGIGWIPYFLERMDQTFEKHRFWTQSIIEEKPSTYWYRQGYATFIRDLVGVAERHRAGLRNIMWSTDYPHSDSTWPRSREALAERFRDVPADERALIAGGNAARLLASGRGARRGRGSLPEPFDPKLLFDHPDPYPLFQMLRQSQPVFETRHLGRPTFLLTTYDDCLAALKDAETYSSRSNREAGQVLGRTLLTEMDGREHGRHRALIQPVFVPKALDGLEPFLEEIVHELVDEIARAPRADFVAALTERYPVQVSAHMLGIPRADHPRYQRWALELMGFPGTSRAEAASGNCAYLLPILAARRSAPRDDIVTRLVHGSVDGERLSDEDVVSVLRLLIPAGAETTFRLIGNMLVALLTERGRFERVRADRSLVPWAIEETLRWETSIVMLSRETTRPTSVPQGPENAGGRSRVGRVRVRQP